MSITQAPCNMSITQAPCNMSITQAPCNMSITQAPCNMSITQAPFNNEVFYRALVVQNCNNKENSHKKLKTVPYAIIMKTWYINPLNPELNPICYLLALLGAHHFLHVSMIRVKSLTLRRLMSYIWSTHS